MRYKIIHHLKSKDDFTVNNLHGLQRILRSVINREQDTIFIVTSDINDKPINIHLLPLRHVSHYLYYLSKLYRIFREDKASKVSITHNIIFKSKTTEKKFTDELIQLYKNNSIEHIYHYKEGKYKELYQE